MSLREDIAHEYSQEVDRLVKTLAKEDGITGAVREDCEVLLVTTHPAGTRNNSNNGSHVISKTTSTAQSGGDTGDSVLLALEDTSFQRR
ncbi:hypothetical protein J2809_001026 [Arthrobacter pascens]|nr:hypothetical protein [Arthrobacter pascens]